MTHALAGAFAPLRPPPLLTVSQWADAHRMLGTESSAEPGRWRTDRTPYLREPMDRLSPTDPCERVVLQWGSQLGKTEAGLNWMGYVIHHQPAPLLMVQPSLEMAELYSEQRFAPLLRSTPELATLTGDPKSRDSGNKKLVKQFPGGFLRMVGANSPASLAGMPARYVFGDEIDRWPASAGREGSPLGLIERRTGSFARRKFLLTSTPTVRGASLVESLMALTGYRRFYVPCPHCGHMQTLRRSQLVWPEGRPREAEYACEDCGACIRDTERTKTTMLLGGEWRPDHPEREDGREYGYHLNTLYAPGGWSSVSWGALAEQWERSKRRPEAVKVYVNTIDGETYDETEDATTDPETLQGRAEVYARPVPEGVRVLDRWRRRAAGPRRGRGCWLGRRRRVVVDRLRGAARRPDWAATVGRLGRLPTPTMGRLRHRGCLRGLGLHGAAGPRLVLSSTRPTGSTRSRASLALAVRSGPSAAAWRSAAPAGKSGWSASTRPRMCSGRDGRWASLDLATCTRRPAATSSGTRRFWPSVRQ
jgi:phage terminase large subunit GpA-like protein